MPARDALLTEFGKDTLRDRYLLPGESYQDMFARVAAAYADDADHAQRVYDYISKLWFMPATPVLSQRRHRPRPADQLLSEQRLRQPRRHRRHVERECLAGLAAAAASAPIGAASAASASRSASTARPAASSRSSG